VHGVRFLATDRSVYDPIRAAVVALVEARRMSGDHWQWNVQHFDRLAGTDQLRRMIDEGLSAQEITDSWEAPRDEFLRVRGRYLIYR
jgi:uncharacterized protein YbbC (DUF1343 family)